VVQVLLAQQVLLVVQGLKVCRALLVYLEVPVLLVKLALAVVQGLKVQLVFREVQVYRDLLDLVLLEQQAKWVLADQ
jgi:hypothetical protein